MVEARHITMDFRIDQNRTTNLKEFVVDTLRRQTHTTTFRALMMCPSPPKRAVSPG